MLLLLQILLHDVHLKIVSSHFSLTNQHQSHTSASASSAHESSNSCPPSTPISTRTANIRARLFVRCVSVASAVLIFCSVITLACERRCVNMYGGCAREKLQGETQRQTRNLIKSILGLLGGREQCLQNKRMSCTRQLWKDVW